MKVHRSSHTQYKEVDRPNHGGDDQAQYNSSVDAQVEVVCLKIHLMFFDDSVIG